MNEAWRVKAAPVDPIRARTDVQKLREYFISTYEHGALYALITTVGVNTGLRGSDLLDLTVGHVRDKTHIDILERKTCKPRRIFINGTVRAAVDKYIDSFLFVVDEARFFTSQKGYVMTVKSLHRLMKQGCEAIGLIGNFGSHTLRKTFAYHVYEYTRDFSYVRRLLQHSNSSVTDAYIVRGDDDAEYTRSDDEVYSALCL